MTSTGNENYVHGYESASQSMARRSAEREAAFFLPLLTQGMNLLDAGCGPGTITLGLAKHVSPGQVTGFDFGPSEIERAKAAAAANQVSNVDFQVIDATDLPFEDSRFDAVFSSAMLEHVPKRERALDELSRVLKPGGVIGIRGGYVPGVLSGPDIATTTRYRDVLAAIWSSRGGDPEFGIKQSSMLSERGFEAINQTAWYETRSDGTSNASARLKESSYAEAIQELGLLSRDEIHQLATAMDENSKSPLAYTHISWIEVTARKPA